MINIAPNMKEAMVRFQLSEKYLLKTDYLFIDYYIL